MSPDHSASPTAWVFGEGTPLAEALDDSLGQLGFRVRRFASGAELSRPDRVAPLVPPQAALLALGADSEGLGSLRDSLDSIEADRPIPRLLVAEAWSLAGGRIVAPAEELLVAPWTVSELEARLRLARTRLGAAAPAHGVTAGGLALDPTSHQVTIAGRPVEFAYMEYLLLRFLMTHPNRVHSRERLLSEVWGYDHFGGTRTVDVHVRRIRAKLGPEHAERLQTVRSVGYRFTRAT